MLQKSSMFRTAEVFFSSPNKEHYLMNISRTTRLAHTSVKKNLKKLVKSGLVIESAEKKGGRKFPIYKANLSEKSFKNYKLINNLSSLLESGLIEFIEQKLAPKSIVLFGSYARGEDIESSDIDLFVECKEEELGVRAFEKKLGRKIELHFMGNFSSYPKELKNNIINGIVLMGFLEGYK
ncbi:MAG TPA: nucleotidyltransferase domain-containing protein [Candidatus Nanoarchaeia archaeon]|nr:nucleotidyltransferase domain-containing protein [Candidatus Nanoarchaeia archaeon]